MSPWDVLYGRQPLGLGFTLTISPAHYATPNTPRAACSTRCPRSSDAGSACDPMPQKIKIKSINHASSRYELYSLTKNSVYLKTAHRFNHWQWTAPLAVGRDNLDGSNGNTGGNHANTRQSLHVGSIDTFPPPPPPPPPPPSPSPPPSPPSPPFPLRLLTERALLLLWSRHPGDRGNSTWVRDDQQRNPKGHRDQLL